MSMLHRGVFLATLLSLAHIAHAADAPLEAGASVSIEVLVIETNTGGERMEGPDEETADAILARVRELKAQNKPVAVTRIRLTTLENLLSTVQTGETVAVEAGRQFRGGQRGEGQMNPGIPVYQHQNFGTVVSATPRIEDDGSILVELMLERTGLAKSANPDERARNSVEAPVVPRSVTLKTQSTLRLKNGETQVIQGIDSSNDETSSETIVLVTARASKDAAKKKPVRNATTDETLREIQVFHLKNATPQDVKVTIEQLLDRIVVVADERTNSVIIHSTPRQLELIRSLIEILDEPVAKQK